MVERTRKRPYNATTLIKKIWGSEHEKNLEIPDFIDGYNHSMNGVDLADQGRAECPTKRPGMRRTWKPLWHWLFDTSLCNMAVIYDAKKHYNRTTKDGLHNTFRKTLAIKLMRKHRSKPYVLPTTTRPGERTVLSRLVQKFFQAHYGQSIKGDKQECCKACQSASRSASARLALGEISANMAKRRTPRTLYKCSQCNIALCMVDKCWQDHLDAYNST
jgi:ribosomal protein S20